MLIALDLHFPELAFGEHEYYMLRSHNKKISSPKLQSISTRSVPSEHHLGLSGQGWWIWIYLFIVPNGLAGNCCHHSASTSLNTRTQPRGMKVFKLVWQEESPWNTAHCEGPKMVLNDSLFFGYKSEDKR